MAFYLAYLLAFYLTFYLAYLLAFYLAFEVQRCALSLEGPRLRSSGAHRARQVPGWAPAVRAELGMSQVEVQRCALSWEGPRLRSSSAHWAPKLAKSLAKSWQGNSGHGSGSRGGRRGGGRGGGGRRRRRKEEDEEEEEEDEENSSDKIYNNPHLAGGAKTTIPYEGLMNIRFDESSAYFSFDEKTYQCFQSFKNNISCLRMFGNDVRLFWAAFAHFCHVLHDCCSPRPIHIAWKRHNWFRCMLCFLH